MPHPTYKNLTMCTCSPINDDGSRKCWIDCGCKEHKVSLGRGKQLVHFENKHWFIGCLADELVRRLSRKQED